MLRCTFHNNWRFLNNPSCFSIQQLCQQQGAHFRNGGPQGNSHLAVHIPEGAGIGLVPEAAVGKAEPGNPLLGWQPREATPQEALMSFAS